MTREALKEWNKLYFGQIYAKRQQLMQELDGLQQDLDKVGIPQVKRQVRDHLYEREQLYW